MTHPATTRRKQGMRASSMPASPADGGPAGVRRDFSGCGHAAAPGDIIFVIGHRGISLCCACRAPSERGLRLGSGGEYLVEQGLGLVLVGVLRERELADQNLARLGEH